MNQDRACELLLRLVAGNPHQPDAEAVRWLVAGLRSWWRDGWEQPGEVFRCLGLPGSRSRIAKRERNRWLRLAAECFGPLSLHAMSTQLHKRADRFERRLWPAWQQLTRPPHDADACDAALFFARQAAPLPATDRGMEKALRGEQLAPVSSASFSDDGRVPSTTGETTPCKT